MIKARKHESINHLLRRFDNQDRRYGTQRDYRKHDFYIGPSKKRQLKSKNARKRDNARRRRGYRKPRHYHYRSNFY